MASTATASSAGPRYAAPDPTLPKPWKGLVDGKTGYLYFWNPVTNVTQYERPTSADSVPKPSVASISSSVQVLQSSGGRCGYSPGKENDRDGRGSEPKLEPVSRTDQNARSGPVHSHNTPNVTSSTVSGVSSARGHGSVTGGSNLSGDAYRRQHEITVTGDEVPPPFSSFESTGFPSELLRELRYLLLRGANIVRCGALCGGPCLSFGVPLFGGQIFGKGFLNDLSSWPGLP